jgi:hypothetical protein
VLSTFLLSRKAGTTSRPMGRHLLDATLRVAGDEMHGILFEERRLGGK